MFSLFHRVGKYCGKSFQNVLLISHPTMFFLESSNLSIVKKNCYAWSHLLTLYHTILTFNNPNEEGFGKHCGKRIKCLYSAFSPFPTMFSTLSKRKIPSFNDPKEEGFGKHCGKETIFFYSIKEKNHHFSNI